MSGTSFALKGSAGAVANTAFMPPIPTKFTWLSARHFGGSFNNGIQWEGQAVDAKKIANWSIANPLRDLGSGPNSASCILGSSVTAPDGTSTATHLIEAPITSPHEMLAGFNIQGINTNFLTNWRLAVIAKAAERTRIRLAVGIANYFNHSDWADADMSGVKTVFDLAGGQIGVAPTTFNGGGFGVLPPGPASISPLGSGWFLCMMDVSTPGGLLTDVVATFNIDAGSGTGAENTNYAGDVSGTFGVNVWTSSFLPVTAWGMGFTQPLFEDFLDLSAVDVHDTRTGNFKFWVHSIWPGLGFQVSDGNTTPSSSIYSQTGSVLTMGPTNAFVPFCSAYTTGNPDGTFNGTAYRIPALFECRYFNDLPTNTTFASDHQAFWANGIKMLATNPQQSTVEMDFTEPAGFPGGNFTFIDWQHGGQVPGQYAGWSGYVTWYSAWKYDQSPPSGGPGGLATVVGRSGTIYDSLVINNLNNDPALTVGTDWAVNNTGVTTPLIPDLTQMHTYSVLCLGPTHDNPGYVMSFFDGIPCNCSPNMVGGLNGYTVITPTVTPYPNTWAQEKFPILVGALPLAGVSVHIDWISVIQ